MKSLISKILSFVLAVLVFVSSTSFILDAHFCGDSLVDWGIIQHAETCGMDTSNEKPADCDNSISKPSCCKDLQIVSQGQDQAQFTPSTLSVDQQIWVVAYIYSYINLLEGLETYIIPYKNYIPPLLTPDLQKLQEIYII